MTDDEREDESEEEQHTSPMLTVPGSLLPTVDQDDQDQAEYIISQLTRQQLRYITVYDGCRNVSEACRLLGISRHIVYDWGPIIDQAIAALQRNRLHVAQASLKSYVNQAVLTLAKGLDDPDPALRYNNARILLEHNLGKPGTKQAVHVDATIKLYGSAVDTDRV